MDRRLKNLNSKAFLLLYLFVVASLLLFWFVATQPAQKEYRDIPDEMRDVLFSPPLPLPQFLLQGNHQRVLTEQSLKGKWSWIYFYHPSCDSVCTPVLDVLNTLQTHYSQNDIQHIVINYDAAQNERVPSARYTPFTIYFAEQRMLDQLVQHFNFLYLRTDYASGYSLEQQHSLFLIDPKGRLYARFEPPFSSVSLQQRFIEIRQFFARTE
jgi:cytochrome oxidase Cu insertion factor (SCO1/SenC/PrrC family)